MANTFLWKEITINNLGKIITGKTPSTSNSAFFNGDIPFITPTDMNDRRVISETERYLTRQGVEAVKGSKIPARTVMVSCIGSQMGKVAIAGKSCVTNQQINSIIVSPEHSELFVYYNLSLRKDEIRSIGSGSAVPILNKTDFSNLPITVPPLSEQKIIAEILGTLDDKIEVNRRMNVTMEILARSIFRQWFLMADEVRNWKIGKLGDIAENVRRGVKPNTIEPDTHYIGLEHMPRKSIALADWGNASELESNKFAFKKGEFLFGKLRPYFHKVGIAPVDGICSTDILVVAPKSPEWYGFVLGHISSVELINYTDSASTGTKMPRTNWSDVTKYEVVLPPVSLAKKYNEIFLPMAEKIASNILESRTLASLRDSLLPKLMKGELRVSKK
jgi:type I restriction enzyme S subunit